MGDWEGRFVASCFIWTQLDLIFKRTKAVGTGTVTIATEVMGRYGKSGKGKTCTGLTAVTQLKQETNANVQSVGF